MNAEKATNRFLADELDARVVTETPADLAAQVPLVLVRGYGGGQTVNLGRPIVETQAFAATRDAARDLGDQVHDLMLFHFRGVYEDGNVSDVVTVLSPAWIAYDNTNLRRFVARYAVYIR